MAAARNVCGGRQTQRAPETRVARGGVARGGVWGRMLPQTFLKCRSPEMPFPEAISSSPDPGDDFTGNHTTPHLILPKRSSTTLVSGILQWLIFILAEGRGGGTTACTPRPSHSHYQQPWCLSRCQYRRIYYDKKITQFLNSCC